MHSAWLTRGDYQPRAWSDGYPRGYHALLYSYHAYHCIWIEIYNETTIYCYSLSHTKYPKLSYSSDSLGKPTYAELGSQAAEVKTTCLAAPGSICTNWGVRNDGSLQYVPKDIRRQFRCLNVMSMPIAPWKGWGSMPLHDRPYHQPGGQNKEQLGYGCKTCPHFSTGSCCQKFQTWNSLVPASRKH